MKAIKELLLQWKEYFKHMTVKRLIPIIIGALLLITPTVLAFLYADYMDNHMPSNFYSVALYDAEGNELTNDSGNPDEALPSSPVKLFYQITSQMKAVQKAPGDPEHDRYIVAKTTFNGVQTDLRCYFSFIDTANYCIDSNGKIYSIPADAAVDFLASPYAEPFYPSATAPLLKTGDKDTVIPSKMTWSYQNYYGEYTQAARNPVTKDSILYEVTGALSLTFEKEPDQCVVQVYDHDMLIYQDSHHNLSTLKADSGHEWKVTVRATWNQKPDEEAYGQIFCQFEVRIRNRSIFSVNTDTIPAGGFALLSCTNITDLSKLTFTTNVEFLQPVFHQEGSMAYALLSLPLDTTLRSITFTLSYGASAGTFTVKIIPDPDDVTASHPQLDLTNSPTLAEAAKTEWNALRQQVGIMTSGPAYFRGNILNPENLGFSLSYEHHSEVKWGKYEEHSFYALGSEYVTNQPGGAAVPVVASGTVLQTGSCTLLGNYVIVDHGMGLRTWYGHLSDLNVEVGDILLKGESVGKTGTGGISTKDGFLLICTVYQDLIHPQWILGKNILG